MMANNGSNYDPIINPDMIMFVLAAVVWKSHDCWVAKVDSNKEFTAKFPEVVVLHAIYWMKKKEILGLAGNVGICVCRLHLPNDRHLCLLPTC